MRNESHLQPQAAAACILVPDSGHLRTAVGAEPIQAHGTAQTCPGFVSLVGAGPGDPDLLTLKAVNRLRAADAIVHDALIPEDIHALFPPRARRFDAGKRGGASGSASQQAIQDLLVRLAWTGKRVVRLKGGDPLIFGRGSEEALHLEAHGVPWEVVPAVSAANGVAAAAALPLTQRGLSAACTLLEGHAEGLRRINWQALVALGGTWVFFMAKATAGQIAAALLSHGAPAYLPVAIVENGTLPEQTIETTTLAWLARDGYRPRSAGPGIVIAGPTVNVFNPLSVLAAHAEQQERHVSHLSGSTG